MLKIAYLSCAFTLCSTIVLSQTQLVLQKGMSGVVMQDAFVKSDMPTTNYGDAFAITLHADVTGSTSPIIRRSYLKWSLSSIPNNAIILSATLELYATTAGGQNTSLERVENSWMETGITWNNAPDGITTDMITTTATMSGSWETFNVTSFVQNWVNYPNNNHGVRVRMASEAGTVTCKGCPPIVRGSTYRSSKYTSVSSPTYQFRPKLIVEYVLPIEIELVSTTHCTTTSSTDGSITISASGGDGTYSYQWYNSSGTTGTNSPTISGLGYGWYGVKVTDGLGVISYMSFLVGVECETVSIAYNPGPNYVDDAFVSSYNIAGSDSRNTNYGSYQYWGVRRYYDATMGGYYNWHSLLRFRLLTDPTLKFNTADLLVNVTTSAYNSSNQIYLYRTVSDWQENVVTYNISPTRSNSITASWGTSATGVKTIDVKDFFDYWKSNSNYGFYVDVENPTETVTNRRMEVRSSEYSTTSQIPRMEFEITLNCPEPTTLRERKDGSVYFMQRPTLKFHFDELRDAETSEKLKFDIRNSSNTVIASSDHAGDVTGISAAVPHLNNGNYHTLYLSALNLVSGEYYTLTVYTISGKKLYLNFIKTN